MASVSFPFDYSKTLYAAQLADELATSFSLSILPTIEMLPSAIVVVHPNVSEANRIAIQTVIDAHVASSDWFMVPNGNEGRLRVKAKRALANNSAFLAIGSPTNVQVVAQVKALTRQMNGLIRIQTNQFDSTDDS